MIEQPTVESRRRGGSTFDYSIGHHQEGSLEVTDFCLTLSKNIL